MAEDSNRQHGEKGVDRTGHRGRDRGRGVLRHSGFVPSSAPTTTGRSPAACQDDIKPFNPKHVVYQVWGPAGTIANINYLDINAQPQKA